MTETTRTVFETHEVRKTRRQKTAFIDYVRRVAAAEGYACHTEKGYLGSRNIIVGDPHAARVVYTAHYDTCARLPFPNFITPLNIWIYILYQLLLTVVLLGVPALLTQGLRVLLVSTTALEPWVIFEITYFGWLGLILAELWLLMAGPANPHTANDNTSGVTTLLDIMTALPAHLRGEVAFIFFDLEEAGLMGSSGYAAGHKDAMRNKLLINFDCVSDGDHILFALRKGAAPHAAAIAAAFPSTDRLTVTVKTRGAFYPSDQAAFPLGVGVAALKSTKGGTLYMDRIHTARDTVYEEENVTYLTEGAIRLAEAMTPHSPVAATESTTFSNG